MQHYLQFIIDNWLLCSLLLVIIALIFAMEMRTQIGGVQKLEPQNAVSLMNHDNAVVVDIRDDKDFELGHIIDAINIPMSELEDKLKKLQKFKEKPIILVCGNGQTSLKAGATLKKNGFESLYSLTGGLTAWKSASFPVTKSTDKKKTKALSKKAKES